MAMDIEDASEDTVSHFSNKHKEDTQFLRPHAPQIIDVQ